MLSPISPSVNVNNTQINVKSTSTPKHGHNIKILTAKKGSVFNILFQPDKKALDRISDAWLRKMKIKKTTNTSRRSKSNQNVEILFHEIPSVDKYFDNLARILQYSASCIELQNSNISL